MHGGLYQTINGFQAGRGTNPYWNTNSVTSHETPETLANNIINLATKSKSKETDVIISGIVKRNDSLNNKVKQVNECIKSKCI